MNHADLIKLLFPLELQGTFAIDAALEGKHLDAAQASAEMLQKEMFPETSLVQLSDWERVCGLTPAPDAPLQARRSQVIRKLREHGGISRAYYIALAASFGWTVTIDELLPFMAGWSRAGDPLRVTEARFIWRVNVSGQAVYRFRAGLSAAGERLTWWIPNIELENMFNNLKPAHTYIIYNYAS